MCLQFRNHFRHDPAQRYLLRDFNRVGFQMLQPLFEYLWDLYHHDYRPRYQTGELRPIPTRHLYD